MANPATVYKILLVKQGRVIERRHIGSPTESMMIRWGTSARAGFVIRYFPSRKGWRLLDVRKAQCFMTARYEKWVGQVRGSKYYPTEDAAVMMAIHMLGCAPSTD